MIFWHKINIDHFNPDTVFLAFATNVPVVLMTGVVLKGHKFN